MPEDKAGVSLGNFILSTDMCVFSGLFSMIESQLMYLRLRDIYMTLDPCIILFLFQIPDWAHVHVDIPSFARMKAPNCQPLIQVISCL